MKIKHVTINNFCNIDHAEYDLKNRNIFIGPNYKGKTNTILAIYWVLTGYLLDGSSSDEELKPRHDTKKKVGVKLEFDDDFTIEKIYYEKWTKTRGSKEVLMTGHETQYFVNGDKYGVREALTELIKRMEYNKQLETSKFGLVRAVIDPFYMAVKCDWKILRSFIIELVGDVSNEDVYATDKILLNIKELLTKYNHDTAKVIKHLKERIKNSVEEIDTKTKGIEELQKLNDVDKSMLDTAVLMIEKNDNNIATYRQQKITAINPDVQKYENEIASIRLDLSSQLQIDQQHLININEGNRDNIQKCQNSIDHINELLNSKRMQKASLEQEEKTFLGELDYLKFQLQRKEQMLEIGRTEYSKIKSSQCDRLIPDPEIEKCPHCGGALNNDYISSIEDKNKLILEKFESDKETKLSNNIEMGKALKLEVDNLKFQISDKEATKQNFDFVELDNEIEKLMVEFVDKKEELSNLKSKLQIDYSSDETKKLREKLNETEIKLREAKAVNTTEDIDNKINECKTNKEQYVSLVSKHNLFVETQERIKQINKEIDVIADAQCVFENQLIFVEKFIQTKLSMLTKNVERVFGTDVKFTLVESNIKEGSWNEVCFPSVLKKDTPFVRGSESEKIITGIYLIECVKKAMSLPDLPIIFDAGSELDSKTLADRLKTNAQLVMTKVDDINYTDVTLIEA